MPRRWPRVALDHMAAGKRIVEPCFKARSTRDCNRLRAKPAAGSSSSAIAEDDRRNPAGGGGMEWQSSSNAQPKRSTSNAKLRFNRRVIGAVGLGKPLFELLGGNRPAATDSHAVGFE